MLFLLLLEQMFGYFTHLWFWPLSETWHDFTHPLLIQFEELLWDSGRVESQPQTLDVQLRDDVFQDFLKWQAAGRSMPCRGWNGILQDCSTESRQLEEKINKQDLFGEIQYVTSGSSVTCAALLFWLVAPLRRLRTTLRTQILNN